MLGILEGKVVPASEVLAFLENIIENNNHNSNAKRIMLIIRYRPRRVKLEIIGDDNYEIASLISENFKDSNKIIEIYNDIRRICEIKYKKQEKIGHDEFNRRIVKVIDLK